EDRFRVDLGVLPVQVGRRGVPLGDIEGERPLECHLRGLGFAVDEECLAQHPIPDHALRFEAALFGTRDELSFERDRLAGTTTTISEREPSEGKWENHWRSSAVFAQLEAALAARRQLRRCRTLCRQKRAHQRSLEIELELATRTQIG